MNLAEKYRPQGLDQVVGQDNVLGQLRTIRDSFYRDGKEPVNPETDGRWLLGQAFWFTGKSGVGKTSLARILSDIVQPYYDRNEIDAADMNLDAIREWEERCRKRPIGCDGWAFTINEAHRLRGPILARLLTTLEKPVVVKNSLWVFTTTPDGESLLFDDEEIERIPFRSRVDSFRFADDEQVTLAFALRLREIAQQENLDGKPLDQYVALVRRHNRNFRECLRVIGRGEFKA